jgi:hypothetical protein
MPRMLKYCVERLCTDAGLEVLESKSSSASGGSRMTRQQSCASYRAQAKLLATAVHFLSRGFAYSQHRIVTLLAATAPGSESQTARSAPSSPDIAPMRPTFAPGPGRPRAAAWQRTDDVPRAIELFRREVIRRFGMADASQFVGDRPSTAVAFENTECGRFSRSHGRGLRRRILRV